jgi:hypothetical protein
MSEPRSPIAEVLRPIPQLTHAKTREIPSGYEISTPPAKNYRLRLPKDCDGLDFLMAVVRNPKIDLDVRIECAVAALPYQKPRLIAVVQQPGNGAPVERVIRIVGGLPRMPGTNTIIPGDPPRPRPAACSPPGIVRETEVGTCTVNEADQLSVK